MSITWMPIGAIPEQLLDGRQVYVRRIFNDHLVKEGLAVFDVPVADAPMLQPIEPDPLGRPENFISAEREADIIERTRTTKRWMNPDRIYAFPAPTEWAAKMTQVES